MPMKKDEFKGSLAGQMAAEIMNRGLLGLIDGVALPNAAHPELVVSTPEEFEQLCSTYFHCVEGPACSYFEMPSNFVDPYGRKLVDRHSYVTLAYKARGRLTEWGPKLLTRLWQDIYGTLSQEDIFDHTRPILFWRRHVELGEEEVTDTPASDGREPGWYPWARVRLCIPGRTLPAKPEGAPTPWLPGTSEAQKVKLEEAKVLADKAASQLVLATEAWAKAHGG